MKRCAVVLAAAVSLAATGIVSAQMTGTLNSGPITDYYAQGSTDSYTLNYSINVPASTGGKADVLFLTDSTGSMGGYIGNVQTAFGSMFGQIQTALPGVDIKYGVADYKYLDGGNYAAYGVNLSQGFTSSASQVQTAFNGLTATGGSDWPESGLKALQTVGNSWVNGTGALNFGGRSDAQKIVIWAGDAPGHYLGETGADGPAGYHPSLAQTLSALNSNGIKVFGLNMYAKNTGIDTNYGGAPQEDYLTAGTGGSSFYSVGNGGPSINDAVVNSIVPSVTTLSNISLNITGDTNGFQVIPTLQTVTGSWTWSNNPVTGTFGLTVIAPNADAIGNFDATLSGNGAVLDTVHFSVSAGVAVTNGSAVPEPATAIAALTVLASCLLLSRRPQSA